LKVVANEIILDKMWVKIIQIVLEKSSLLA